MKISFENKNALVGGSTQGLGKAIAIQLAACGANVTLMARNEDRLKKVLQLLNTESGQKHGYLVVDFSDLEHFRKTIGDFLRSHPIHILINNTQGPEAGSVLEKGPAHYQDAFNLLFQTVCFTTLEALPAMRKIGYGRIINVSSLSIREPSQNLVLSNTIRIAVTSWAKSLATEVARDNITVNTILTGNFDTERMSYLIGLQAKSKDLGYEEYKASRIEAIPMKRLGRPEEYAYLVAFLASDYASYITGTNFPIDGGLLKSIG
ncbi:MAG TPA: SDR family oxidoreductase [Bacteroidales bacterium]|nr:SDR family oxidoreductase [Bacteroidales bacterium]